MNIEPVLLIGIGIGIIGGFAIQLIISYLRAQRYERELQEYSDYLAKNRNWLKK